MRRKILIGDIRGELGLLKELLDKIQPTPEDYLLFLGSYLGPGPDSKGVLDYVIDLQINRPKDSTAFLIGCYEKYFGLIIADNPDLTTRHVWAHRMKGEAVLRSYAQSKVINFAVGKRVERLSMTYSIPTDHIHFLDNHLRDWYQDHDYPFVASHAGFNPYNYLSPTQEEVVYGPVVNGVGWWESDWRLPNVDIIFSHIPFNSPYLAPGKIGIDTGAGFGGTLSAIEFPSKQIFNAGAERRASVS